MRCDSGREDLLAGQADDAIPVVGCDAVVLSDHHGQEVLCPVGCWHRVQAAVCLFPGAGQKVVDAFFESRYVFIRQLGPVAMWRQQFTDGVRGFEAVGKHAGQSSQPCLVGAERISDAVGSGLIHQDGDMELSGQALQSAGQIDNRPEHGDFDLVRGSNLSGDGTSVRDTDSQ